jgi:16S rRNA processing protein RimM
VRITVGRIARAHGLRGDVVVDVRTDDPDLRFALGTTFATPRGDLVVDASRWHGSGLLVRFEHVRDRESAERLRGLELALDVPSDERPDDPDEYYDHQLRGLSAYTVDGTLVGEVLDVLHLPTQDTLVLDLAGREALVPFVAEIVPEVDLAGGRLVIADVPGLLDPAPEPAAPVAADGSDAGG